MGAKGGCIRKAIPRRRRHERKKMGWLGFRRIRRRNEEDVEELGRGQGGRRGAGERGRIGIEGERKGERGSGYLRLTR